MMNEMENKALEMEELDQVNGGGSLFGEILMIVVPVVTQIAITIYDVATGRN